MKNTDDYPNSNFSALIKEKTTWIPFTTDRILDYNSSYTKFEITKLILENDQYIKVNTNTIINLLYLECLQLKGKNQSITVDKVCYPISTKYLNTIIKITKSEEYQRYFSKTTINTKKATWISKTNNQIKLSKINTDNVQYLIREGVITTVHFSDESKTSFYETLKYFEKDITTFSPFIRIRRNCIINLKHLERFRINKKSKTGNAIIGAKQFNISRRLLPQFRSKVKFNGLMCLKENLDTNQEN